MCNFLVSKKSPRASKRSLLSSCLSLQHLKRVTCLTCPASQLIPTYKLCHFAPPPRAKWQSSGSVRLQCVFSRPGSYGFAALFLLSGVLLGLTIWNTGTRKVRSQAAIRGLQKKKKKKKQPWFLHIFAEARFAGWSWHFGRRCVQSKASKPISLLQIANARIPARNLETLEIRSIWASTTSTWGLIFQDFVFYRLRSSQYPKSSSSVSRTRTCFNCF